MSSVILTGDTSGTLTLSAPLVAGSNTVTLPAATGTISLLTQATAVASTSGTNIDFTGIPSWAKRISVIFNGVSLSGSANHLIQIGSGSFTGSTYSSVGGIGAVFVSSTSGYIIFENTASRALSGIMTLVNISGNIWIESHSAMSGSECRYGGGTGTSAGTLDRIRVTSSNGTDTFDAGSINIMYEG